MNTRKRKIQAELAQTHRDAKHCLTPVNPGHLCTADGEDGAKCAAGEVCCPLIKVRTSCQQHSHNRLTPISSLPQECVKVGAVCAPPAFETPVWV